MEQKTGETSLSANHTPFLDYFTEKDCSILGIVNHQLAAAKPAAVADARKKAKAKAEEEAKAAEVAKEAEKKAEEANITRLKNTWQRWINSDKTETLVDEVDVWNYIKTQEIKHIHVLNSILQQYEADFNRRPAVNLTRLIANDCTKKFCAEPHFRLENSHIIFFNTFDLCF